MTLLEQYRDDGPVAQALGSVGARLPRVPPFLVVGAAVVALLALISATSHDASDAEVAAGVAWLVLLGGISNGLPHADRFAWTVPGFLRVGEYAALLWIGANAGGAGAASAFAVIGALAFRHYDVVYRPRYQGVSPPGWLAAATGGWDGRLVLAWILLALGLLPAGFFVLAGLLAAVVVTECALSWRRLATRPLSVYDDEEDEGQ